MAPRRAAAVGEGRGLGAADLPLAQVAHGGQPQPQDGALDLPLSVPAVAEEEQVGRLMSAMKKKSTHSAFISFSTILYLIPSRAYQKTGQRKLCVIGNTIRLQANIRLGWHWGV